MKKQIIALSTALLVVFTACEKDEQTTPEPPKVKTKTELLTEAIWDINYSRTVASINDSILFDETDYMIGTADFRLDNTVISTLDGEPDDTSGWSLNGDILVIDDMPFDIVELTSTNLNLMLTESEVLPGYGTVKTTMETKLSR